GWALAPVELGPEPRGGGRFPRIRALVRFERGMAVRVGGGAVEEPEDLRDVVLVHAQVVKPSHVLVAERLVFRLTQPELAADALEVREPARAERGVAAHVE